MSETPPADPALCASLDKLVADLQLLAPAALGHWDETAIHQSRVATRRLKAGLDLFRPVLSDDARRPFAKVTRRLRRRLGPLRDLDVMLGHLEHLGGSGRHAGAVEWLAKQLTLQREKAREDAQEDASPAKVLGKLATSWSDVRREILESGEAINSLLAASVHTQLDGFASRADRLAGVAGETNGSAEATDVHELRIAGKALRYTLEMARAHGRPLDAGVTRAFKRMQDALGLWHDYVVLTEWAMRASVEGLLAHHDMKLQADVLALARLTLSRAGQRLKRFAALWRENGTSLQASIRQAFPIITANVDPPPVEPVPRP